MSPLTISRLRAAVVAGAAALVLVGFTYHPYLSRPTDEMAIGAVAAEDTTRWAIAHLAVAIGYALMVLAFMAIRGYLREAGEDRFSALALPFIAFGSTAFIMLTGMEFAPIAAARAGADAGAVQSELAGWFMPILLVGALSFALGALGFALAFLRSRALAPSLTWLAVAGLVVMALARFIPLGWMNFVIGLAAIAALWPAAYEMWMQHVHQVGPEARALTT